jgi:gas vesicle protein
MNRKGSSIGNLVIGILIGGLVGVGVALLSAPQSGSQTRSMLREKGVEYRDRANSTIQETRVKAEDAITKVRSRAEELSGRFGQRGMQTPQSSETAIE